MRTTYSALRRHADELFQRREVLEALRVYLHLLELQPADHQLRLHAADALARLGQRGRALRVVAAIALGHLQAGRTLPALLAARALEELAPGRTEILGTLAQLYGAASPRVRAGTPPPRPIQLPSAEITAPRGTLTPSDLLARVTEVAAGRADAGRDAVGPLPPLPLFGELEPEDALRMLTQTRRRRFPRGSLLLVEGDPGDSFYLLAHGSVRVEQAGPQGPVELAVLSEGDIVGEMALVLGRPRVATVRALEDTDALEVPYPALLAVAKHHPAVASALRRFTRRRLVRAALGRSALLAGLAAQPLEEVADLFEGRSLAAGEVLLRAGSPGPGLFLLVTGRCQVLAGEAGAESEVARLGPGEVLGEIGLVTGAPANATVRALQPCELLFLPRERFGRLLGVHPHLREGIESLAEARRVETQLSLNDLPVVAPGDLDASLELDDDDLLEDADL